MIEVALKTRLGSFAGLTALVGAKVFPAGVAQQGAVFPYCTYMRVSSERDPMMGVDSGLVRGRYNVTSFADTYAGVKAIAEQVRLALARYRATVGGVEIQDIYIENEADFYDDNVQAFYIASDFEVVWRE